MRSDTVDAPASASPNRVELTIRGLILGGLITLVFTAANVYLGLKVGLTIATSIPAAVISMAILRAVRNATIWENNIVQTVASAAGTLSSVIFVLPGLIMVSWWTHFPFWQSFAVCLVGGVLGVMYSVPLRRALVTQSSLPYPEGVAAAEVLKVGAGSHAGTDPLAIAENKAGLLTVGIGALASAGFYAVVQTRIFIDVVKAYFRIGNAETGMEFGLSLALLGAGHLIGLAVGLAMLVGILIAWAILTPVLTALHPLPGTPIDVATAVWHSKVRLIGAGTIGIAGIWTLGKLAKPVWTGIGSSLSASRIKAAGRGAELPITEQDIPFRTVVLVSLACLVPLAVMFIVFLSGGALAGLMIPLIVGSLIYVFVAGLLVAAACGYMAGLIGSSNSPVSGLAILTVIGASVLLAVMGKNVPNSGATLVAFALFVTAVVLCIATISNDNLQDLKTGQLVGATPWRQQVALIVGVVFGAIVIPPILDLLNQAYGFIGAPNASAHALSAPQASLISTLAKGVIQHNIDWHLIGIGVLIGLVIITIDEVGSLTKTFTLAPLAVGLGIYLPASTTLTVVAGAVVGHIYNQRVRGRPNGEIAVRLGVLLASGLIVGESLFGVLNAGLIVSLKGNPTPLALVGDSFATPSIYLGSIAFIVVVWGLYAWIARKAQTLV